LALCKKAACEVEKNTSTTCGETKEWVGENGGLWSWECECGARRGQYTISAILDDKRDKKKKRRGKKDRRPSLE